MSGGLGTFSRDTSLVKEIRGFYDIFLYLRLVICNRNSSNLLTSLKLSLNLLKLNFLLRIPILLHTKVRITPLLHIIHLLYFSSIDLLFFQLFILFFFLRLLIQPLKFINRRRLGRSSGIISPVYHLRIGIVLWKSNF